MLLPMSDAPDTLLKALHQLWPDVPHQTCQFHALREASRPVYEIDRSIKTQLRKELQPQRRAPAHCSARQAGSCTGSQAIGGLRRFRLGVDHGTQFRWHLLSIRRWRRLVPWTRSQAVWSGGKKRGAIEPRMQTEVGSTQNDRGGTQPLGPADRLRQAHAKIRSWMPSRFSLEARVKPGEPLSKKKVGGRFDRWRQKWARSLVEGSWTPVEQACLEQFLQGRENLRPHLILCYDPEQFPRTNNDMEGSIRGLKTRSRRISGRKNWNSYATRATVGVWPPMPGGNSKPKGSKSFWKQANGSAQHAGGGCAKRPRLPKARNSSVFAFATSERPLLPPLSSAAAQTTLLP